ncbi:unnamed protein product [Musa acuminata subsp. burmannicoides]
MAWLMMAVKRFERNTLKLPSSTVHDHLNLIRVLRQVFQQLRIHQMRVGNRSPRVLQGTCHIQGPVDGYDYFRRKVRHFD